MPCTCPPLVYTVRRTALGPKDASTSSTLGVVVVTAVMSAPLWTREGLGRAGRPPPGHGRCSFDTRRGTPARDTLLPGRGAMQGLSAVRITRTGDVRWCATAPMRARPRTGHASLAGTAPKATPPSACCPTAWRRGFPASSTPSKAVVANVEQAPSLSATANALRPDTKPPEPIEIPESLRLPHLRMADCHRYGGVPPAPGRCG